MKPMILRTCLTLLVVGLVGLLLAVPSLAGVDEEGVADTTIVLADPGDPFYGLAQEMAGREGLLLVHSLDEALAQNPTYLLWVVSPRRLSAQILVEYGKAVRNRESAISMGIISGTTLQDARALWLRASEVEGNLAFAANAGNTAGNIKAEIIAFDEGKVTTQALTRPNLVQSLQDGDHVTFTGHGGSTWLGLDPDTKLRAEHITSLPPVVVATGSCNAFQPWESESIALAFVDKGAAAYSGFVFSPNSGYQIGAFEGVPHRYTWPGFPIGHVVQVQSRGTLQGFAQVPYLHLLGDPRIALQLEAPYRLVEDNASGNRREIRLTGVPAGSIPVRIPDGAGYSFVEIPGVGAGWEGDPFYNARLQMVDIGDDKFILFEHHGGDVTLRLGTAPSWAWVAGDVVTDALDHTFLFLLEGGGDSLAVVLGVFALLPVIVLLVRKKAPISLLVPASAAGIGFAILHGLFALARLDRLTITSKTVVFHPLGLFGTFLLVASGAFLFLSARTWRGRTVAIVVASLGALAPAVFLLGSLSVTNALFLGPRVGASLWNLASGWQALIAFFLEFMLFGLAFALLRRSTTEREASHL